MTEEEWLSCANPIEMLELLKERRVTARRYRLFAAACTFIAPNARSDLHGILRKVVHRA